MDMYASHCRARAAPSNNPRASGFLGSLGRARRTYVRTYPHPRARHVDCQGQRQRLLLRMYVRMCPAYEVRQPRAPLISAGMVECTIAQETNKVHERAELRSCLGYLNHSLRTLGAEGPWDKDSPYPGLLPEHRWHVTLSWESNDVIPCEACVGADAEKLLLMSGGHVASEHRSRHLWSPHIARSKVTIPARELPAEVRSSRKACLDCKCACGVCCCRCLDTSCCADP